MYFQFYFLHQKAPPARHCYEIFNPNMVREPAKQPLNVLSGQWARYVEKVPCTILIFFIQKFKTLRLGCDMIRSIGFLLFHNRIPNVQNDLKIVT